MKYFLIISMALIQSYATNTVNNNQLKATEGNVIHSVNYSQINLRASSFNGYNLTLNPSTLRRFLSAEDLSSRGIVFLCSAENFDNLIISSIILNLLI